MDEKQHQCQKFKPKLYLPSTKQCNIKDHSGLFFFLLSSMSSFYLVTLFAILTELVKFLIQAGPFMQRPNTGKHFRFYFDDDELELLVNAS